MGIFDAIKKKNDSSPEEIMSTRELGRYITQNVAICINQMHITEQPVLRFFKEGADGIITGFIYSHLNDPQLLAIKEQNKEMYLWLLCSHALGCGGYVTLCQRTFGKSVSDFSHSEAEQIAFAFRKTDTYELFLNTIGFPLDGNNKKCVDQIIRVAINSAKDAVGDNLFQNEYLDAMMRVLFNAGITVVLR